MTTKPVEPSEFKFKEVTFTEPKYRKQAFYNTEVEEEEEEKEEVWEFDDCGLPEDIFLEEIKKYLKKYKNPTREEVQEHLRMLKPK
ncbi:hypothetical protein M9Y10_028888 [Tritrichomonas musculus]|uniref:Uncharacterized protein n=1 Tax=Tritrichomonas musculus TaxID=1915356 RepID=A0ABR2KKJ5_9EUKA